MSNAVTALALPDSAVRTESSLANRAAHGAFWTILFSLLNKGVALGAQIALAWFLVPDQFGAVAMVISIGSIASVVSGTNLKNLLIQGQKDFAEDAGQVFWLSLTMNLAAAVCLAFIAPFAGDWFGDKRLVSLLWILSAAIPVMALPTVYVARLYRDLRFPAIARIQFGEGLIRNSLALPLAAAGFGPSSMVIPIFVSAAFAAICVRCLAGPVHLGRPNVRCWPRLLAPSGWLMAIAFISAMQNYGTNLVLGCTQNPTSVGLYFWGFSMASQAIFLLASNLQSIFFPVLSKLNGDLMVQGEVFIKICRTLIVAIVPICVLQVVLARPAIMLIFHDHWLPAVPTVQWLSVGMLAQPLSIVTSALLMARGEFRRLAIFGCVSAVFITAGAYVGGLFGGPSYVACAVAVSMTVANFWLAHVSWSQVFGRERFLGRILPLLGIFFPLTLAGRGLERIMMPVPVTLRLFIVSFAVLTLYAYFVWVFCPELLRLMSARIKSFGNSRG